jgi:hypothetical protein
MSLLHVPTAHRQGKSMSCNCEDVHANEADMIRTYAVTLHFQLSLGGICGNNAKLLTYGAVLAMESLACCCRTCLLLARCLPGL